MPDCPRSATLLGNNRRVTDHPSDRPPGDPTPEDTWERLQRLYGAEGERPPDVDAPMDAAPIDPSLRTPTATPQAPKAGRTQYYVPAGESSQPPPAAQAARARSAYEESTKLAPDAGSVRKPSSGEGASGAGSAGGRSRSSRRLLRWIPHPKRKWFRPKLRWVFLYLPLLIVVAIVAIVVFAWSTFSDIHRIDLGDALRPTSATAVNYLIVGSDSRDGIDPGADNIGAIGTNVSGHRSDTIIVMRLDQGKATMMSIPRDLWVTNVKTGQKGRINGAYNDSQANLVRTVTANLGIPVHHYVEVDFVTFSGMVEAMGGITINFPNPAFDTHSGLKVTTSGDVLLNGTQALAYVRSRHYTEMIAGKPKPDPTGDKGRQLRQKEFIRAVLAKVGGTRNPWTLTRIAGAASKGMRVDTALGFGDAISLARGLGDSKLATVILPTHDARKGSAAVLELDDVAAQPILAGFGGGTH